MMSSRLTPAQAMLLAMTSDHTRRSLSVYATTVGLPVVPEEAWISLISAMGTANIPKG
jgi:hypothetical protein